MTLFGGRFLIRSYLQVFLMICFQNIHSQTTSKSSWNCVGQIISLECPENAVITILTATLGYSGASPCQPSDLCRVNTDPSHAEHLKNECTGQQRCSIKAIQGKIKCPGWQFSWDTNFEYITYNCNIRPEHTTPARISGTESDGFPNGKAGKPDSDKDQSTDAAIPNNKDEHGIRNEDAEPTNMTKMIAVVTTCAILILIAIITLVVILRRRKKKKLPVNAMQMSDVSNAKSEEANVNAEQNCNNQNPMRPSGSRNNSKECNTTNNATHSPPQDTYESLKREYEDTDRYQTIIRPLQDIDNIGHFGIGEPLG